MATNLKKLVRWVCALAIILIFALAVFVGYGFLVERMNPHLPSSDWPILRLADVAPPRSNVTIVVADDVRVSLEQPGIEYWECDIAADPANPSHLFATSMVINEKQRGDLAGYFSHDGGMTWQRGFFFITDKSDSNPLKHDRYGDPSICFGNNGKVHLVVMAGNDHGLTLGDTDRSRFLEFWSSNDAGKTWRKRAVASRFVDRPFTVVDTTDSSADSRFQYTIGNVNHVVIYSHSEQAVETGSETFPLKEPFANNRPANPVILSNGTAMFAAEDHFPTWNGISRPNSVRKIHTFFCRDQKNIVPGPHVNTKWWHDSIRVSRASLTYFPRLAANPHSKRFVDYVYCVWADGRNDDERILISASRDGGQSWDYPVVISEQELEVEGDNRYLSVLPSIAVNNNGVVAVTWYDRRGLPPSKTIGNSGQPDEPVGWNIRARVSTDGGKTWLPSFQLNREQSTGVLNVGHTAGLAASSDGRFHALWIDSRSGKRMLWSTSFHLE